MITINAISMSNFKVDEFGNARASKLLQLTLNCVQGIHEIRRNSRKCKFLFSKMTFCRFQLLFFAFRTLFKYLRMFNLENLFSVRKFFQNFFDLSKMF